MLLMLMAIHLALPQDGPIQTAPPGVEATAPAVPPREPAAAVRRYNFGRITRDPTLPRLDSVADCRDPARRGPQEDAFDCAVRFQRQAEPDRAEAATPETGVPAWALTDPARWETSQCGAAGDEACRRQARNRLAMARAGLATEGPAPSGATAPETCRMVMQRSETGFGGTLMRVCADGDEEAMSRQLGNMMPSLPVEESCDRPAALESQGLWIARCRALPPR